jgi:hypothetical protein
MEGAPQGPLKSSPLRQTIRPRPWLPPNPNPTFSTEGNTITHSVFCSSSAGMLSGIWSISLIIPACAGHSVVFLYLGASRNNIEREEYRCWYASLDHNVDPRIHRRDWTRSFAGASP